jgi:hypothetical protein
MLRESLFSVKVKVFEKFHRVSFFLAAEELCDGDLLLWDSPRLALV